MFLQFCMDKRLCHLLDMRKHQLSDKFNLTKSQVVGYLSLGIIPAEAVNSDQDCVKSVRIQSYSGPCFPTLRLSTGRYFVSLRIQSECWKIRIRITPNTDPFYVEPRVCFSNKIKQHVLSLRVFQTSKIIVMLLQY